MKILYKDFINAIKFGFTSFAKNFKFFVLLSFILTVISVIVSQFIGEIIQTLFEFSWIIKLFITKVLPIVINFIASIWFFMKTIKIGLNFYEDKSISVGQVLDLNPGKLLLILGATLWYGLIVFIGLVFGVIPGIFWGIKYFFVNYLIIDKNSSIDISFSQSDDTTYHAKWRLLFFVIFMLIVFIILNIISMFFYKFMFLALKKLIAYFFVTTKNFVPIIQIIKWLGIFIKYLITTIGILSFVYVYKHLLIRIPKLKT